jgi:hypothetical protein
VIALGAVPPAGAASSGEGRWTVALRGLDVTREADPVLAGGVLLVDAAALGPSLRLAVRAAGREVTVWDPAGVEWRGTAGGALLSAPGRTLALDRPIRVEGRSLYLPAETVAELAGLHLALHPEARAAVFADPEAASGAPSSGWQTFTRMKPASPQEGDGTIPRRSRQDLRLPPDHDTLRVGLGLGAVPGTDWGSELTATGSARGIETGINALLTSGPQGAEIQNGHAALADPSRGWGAEAGDLFNEIWGFASGARYRWRRGVPDRASWPTFSLYLPNPRAGNKGTVLAFGDEIRLGAYATLGGELASDGSWVMSGRLRRQGLSLFGYRREASGRFETRGSGLSGSLELPAGLSLQAALSRGGPGGRRLETRTFSLRIPLRSSADLSLESARSAGQGVRSRMDAIAAGGAFGRLQLRSRYQRRETEVLALLSGHRVRFAQDELLTAASWLAGSRLRLEAQLAERWPERGQRDEWRQVNASWALSPHTSLQLFATSSSSDLGDTFRLRLDREVRPGLSLFAEYGDVATFQSLSIGPGEDRSRFRVMVRRTWDVATPASGGEVEGIVDTGDLPAAGVPVELGPYRTVTDRAGRYTFPNVPPGRYELRLPPDGLPADSLAGPLPSVQVKRRQTQRADIPLIPLGEARGWVYVDRNGNGRRDPGEGIGGAVLVLDGRATSSAGDGSFGFFNLPPGQHHIRIEAGRLPTGIEALVPSRMELGLPPGQSVDHLEFRLREKAKPIVFQEVRR